MPLPLKGPTCSGPDAALILKAPGEVTVTGPVDANEPPNPMLKVPFVIVLPPV